MLKKIPEEDLVKAIGGMTKRHRRILFAVGGALVAFLSAFGFHKFMRSIRHSHRDEENAKSVEGTLPSECSQVQQGNEANYLEFEEKTKDECLLWMQQHNLSRNNVKGWNGDNVAAYIVWGGDLDLLPGLVKTNLEGWNFL